MEGWIQLHRKFIDWEWYSDHHTSRLFIHCLLLANHKDRKWRGIDIKRGSFITSREKLAAGTGLSVQSIRTSLNRLKSTNEITSKTTSKHTIVTICNYDTYQSSEVSANQQNNQQSNPSSNQQVTNKQPASNQQVTTTNNDNNINNDNNDKKEEVYTFDQFWVDYNKKFNKPSAKRSFDRLSKKVKIYLKDYVPLYAKAYTELSEQKYKPYPATFPTGS